MTRLATAALTRFEFPPYLTSFARSTPGQANNKVAGQFDAELIKIDRGKLKQVYAKLDDMKTWHANWDDYNANKPNAKAIKKAEQFIKELFEFTEQLQCAWLSPNITASSDGEVLLEWWGKEKDLTIYLSATEITYIKVKHDDIDNMEDGNLDLNKNIIGSLWEWFII